MLVKKYKKKMWNGMVMVNLAVSKAETSLERFWSLLSSHVFEKYSFHRKCRHLKVWKNYLKMPVTTEYLGFSQTYVTELLYQNGEQLLVVDVFCKNFDRVLNKLLLYVKNLDSWKVLTSSQKVIKISSNLEIITSEYKVKPWYLFRFLSMFLFCLHFTLTRFSPTLHFI